MSVFYNYKGFSFSVQSHGRTVKFWFEPHTVCVCYPTRIKIPCRLHLLMISKGILELILKDFHMILKCFFSCLWAAGCGITY